MHRRHNPRATARPFHHVSVALNRLVNVNLESSTLTLNTWTLFGTWRLTLLTRLMRKVLDYRGARCLLVLGWQWTDAVVAAAAGERERESALPLERQRELNSAHCSDWPTFPPNFLGDVDVLDSFLMREKREIVMFFSFFFVDANDKQNRDDICLRYFCFMIRTKD